MRSQIKHYRRRVDDWLAARTIRERGILLAALLCSATALWSLFWMDPAVARRADIDTRIGNARGGLGEVARQKDEIMARHAYDPNHAHRARKASLEEQIAKSEARIREYTAGMTRPDEMTRLLEGMLRESRGLEVVRVENLGAEPLWTESEAASDRQTAGVFKHAFEIELRGPYLRALEAMRSLEALDAHFFWEGLEYRVIEHPDGIATIRTFTLSTDEDWIGA